MAIEIERKFRVNGTAWRSQVRRSTLLRQGYLANTERCSVRVRVAGEQGWLSVKAMTPGIARAEYEAPISPQDATAMLDTLCSGPLIEKWRHIVPGDGGDWEIDEFLGDNAGLVVAEIELPSEEAPFARPDWLGREVTQELHYYNFRLTEQPYSRWPVEWRAP